MNKWNLIIDIDKCHNCANCFIAAKDEYVGNEFSGYSAPQPLHGHAWIRIDEYERGTYPAVQTSFVPKMCNHCDDAPCKKVGGDAVQKRADGIVIIDPIKAKGREDIAKSCPYGAIFWNDELQIPQHWTFDAHLLDQGWKEPRCAQVCPTGAITALKTTDQDMETRVAVEDLRPINSNLQTKPRVYYKNLDNIEKCFIAGRVIHQKDNVSECFENADITLKNKEGEVVSSTQSDVYGDFRFNGLDPQSGEYEIIIDAKSSGVKSVKTVLGESLHLGTISLD